MRYLKKPSSYSSVLKNCFRLLICLIIAGLALTCNREMLDPDPNALPSFSTDTITFDTVFTSIGSATLSFKVYNRSNRPLLINSIALAGGEASFFRLNIDGEALPYISNIEVAPDDSLYVFIAVTVDPTNNNNPVVVRDSIVFNTHGKLQDIKLLAFGQDVHLMDGRIVHNTVWENDKPYLIYNSMAVDTGQTLSIQAGAQIYFHRNSSLIVWGTLLVEGTEEEPVIFQNDRLEEFYRIIPGQWGTIYIDPISRGNSINHAIIINAIAGIQIGYPSNYLIPEVEISNCMIMNVSFAGIYAFGAEINCYNTVIANSAGPAVALLRGGDYRFHHCTIINNGVPGTSRSSPAVVLTNTFNNIGFVESGALQRAEFSNSIIYGSYAHEIQLINNQTDLFNFQFNHCILKAIQDSIHGDISGNFASVILNEDPSFVNDSDRYHLNFRLDTLSPAKDSGDVQLLISYPYLEMDITGSFRNSDGMPDLGAFERKED